MLHEGERKLNGTGLKCDGVKGESEYVCSLDCIDKTVTKIPQWEKISEQVTKPKSAQTGLSELIKIESANIVAE